MEKSLKITAYFDFMCPWSYLAKARVKRALARTGISHLIEWIPFELYAGNHEHRVERKTIHGHDTLSDVYTDLHELGARERLIIRHPRYEGSSHRALTGYLYARKEGAGEKYLDELFEQTFEHVNDISSLAVLSRVAVKMGFDVSSFIAFIENPNHQAHVTELTHRAKQNGVKGLPSYRVNGLPVVGALPVNEWVSLFETLRAHKVPMMTVPAPARPIPPKQKKHVSTPAPKKPKLTPIK